MNLLINEMVLVKAKKYVISAGAVLTAGILFNSQIRPDGISSFGAALLNFLNHATKN